MVFSVGLLVVSYFTASAVSGFPPSHLAQAGFGGADVVLSCSLVEEGAGLGTMGASGSQFSRTPATLVLRDLPVSPDLSPETLTPYNPPANPDPDDIIIEAKVTSPEIPEADSLLHADCNEQEVSCEISRYFPRGVEVDAAVAYFIGSVMLEGGGISLTLVLQTLPPMGEGEQSAATPLLQSKLELPLTQSGTILTEVAFLVFSRLQSLRAPLGGDAQLDCGFKQQDPFPVHAMWLEWRLQHRGSGRRVLEMKAMETEEQPIVHVDRNGSSVDLALVVKEGNVSLTLTKVKVPDEGTYICTVSAGLYQAQQVIQLHLTQPPHVSLSVDTVIFKDGLPQKVSCHCERYYPLDVEVEWLYLLPSKEEPISLTQNSSLTSHRQYSDRTLSLSSHLTIHPSALPAGTVVTCVVSHSTLATPLSVSLTVSAPEPARSYWMLVGMVAATLLSLYFLLK
ncbi:hypothetical protein SKAU_G00225270 [Synaphobranchus kaupii]|uniref:Ig-like domain-containing protein n=1 Tax=Synaphobranchus kaupii TaxID=118154 RepID=A0A9Q1IU78_SYNKA|nr:hypothetical protein SKAU_G00225270 [Synaphobranchus kaupii]